MASDNSLIRRVRSGEENAATDLYDRYAARVFGLVQKQMAGYLQAHTEPEDIVQSVFRSVFRGVNHAGYEAPDGGTLWQLIAVLAVNKVRRSGSALLAAKRDVRRSIPLDSHGDLEETTPQEVELAIRESIEQLTDAEREVVSLRLQAFTIYEIAEKTSKSRRSVERLLQSAREALADSLSDSID
jgi:RNA polymerase sigma-70 factor (ECF subfamily)